MTMEPSGRNVLGIVIAAAVLLTTAQVLGLIPGVVGAGTELVATRLAGELPVTDPTSASWVGAAPLAVPPSPPTSPTPSPPLRADVRAAVQSRPVRRRPRGPRPRERDPLRPPDRLGRRDEGQPHDGGRGVPGRRRLPGRAPEPAPEPLHGGRGGADAHHAVEGGLAGGHRGGLLGPPGRVPELLGRLLPLRDRGAPVHGPRRLPGERERVPRRVRGREPLLPAAQGEPRRGRRGRRLLHDCDPAEPVRPGPRGLGRRAMVRRDLPPPGHGGPHGYPDRPRGHRRLRRVGRLERGRRGPEVREHVAHPEPRARLRGPGSHPPPPRDDAGGPPLARAEIHPPLARALAAPDGALDPKGLEDLLGLLEEDGPYAALAPR